MARTAIRIKIKETGKVDDLLGQLPIALREKILVKAIRKAGNVVAREAKRLAPKPGYAGDDPGTPPLNKSVKVVIRKRADRVAGFIGPTRQFGPHGHLVEYGHKKVLWGNVTGEEVAGKPFLRPAADSTESQQQTAIVDTLKAEVKKLRA